MNECQFREHLTKWYQEKGRDLPWRRTRDPYHIWVSEIMLQQTQVATVIPYFERFTAAFPKISDLAAASLDEVYKLWEGLGYYRRASHLKEAAMDIMERFDGEFPSDYDDIISLKGIGAYTASAIASIAFGIPTGVIDGNTLRILSRIYNMDDNIAEAKTRSKYQKIIDELIDRDDPSAFNQGMMDLGATICTPRNPKCESCPVSAHCLALAKGTEKLLPVNIKNIKKTDLYYITCVLSYDDKYFMIKNEEGLLVNLYGLVQFDVESPLSFEERFMDEYGIAIQLTEYIKEVKHVFTHKTWHMNVYTGQLLEKPDENLYNLKELEELPISTAHKKVLTAARQ